MPAVVSSPHPPHLKLVTEQSAAGELLRGLRVGRPEAERRLFELHHRHVERILTRVLGTASKQGEDIDDLVQEVFIRAFDRVAQLREADALKAWLTSIAVFVARETIRKRKRRSWLTLLTPDQPLELEAPNADPEVRDAMRAFYQVVERLDADERVAFTLRLVEGMELKAIADACGVSLATVKRRVKTAETKFVKQAKRHPALADWVKGGSRWN